MGKKLLYGIPLLALLLMGASCNTAADVNTDSDTQASIDGSTTEQETDIQATVRANIEESLEADFDAWVEDYQEWSSRTEANIEIAAVDVKAELTQEWENLKEEIDNQEAEVQTRLNAMRTASADTWARANVEAQAALDELQDLYLEAQADFSADTK